ncbi:MAG: ABC transporter permease [Planctomycetota bacterium]
MLGPATLRTVRLGIKSLLLHKLRAALTMLGMLFGVFSVIAMLAIGEGASYEAQQQIKALGSTNIIVRTTKPPDTEQTNTGSMWSAKFYGLLYRDAERIRDTLQNLELIIPIRETRREARVGAAWYPTDVLGTVPAFAVASSVHVAEGRWLSDVDEARTSNVAVLGAIAAKNLFPLEPPIGRTVLCGNDRFEVVGVLQYQGLANARGPTLDECIFVPMSTSRSWFGDIQTKMTGGTFERTGIELHEIKVRVGHEGEVLDTARVIEDMLAQTHPEKDYEVIVPLRLLMQAEETKRIFNLVLGAIASISLLVGGIGIMNVMLATVTERTREIGIRRALGAKKKNIISQFLVETIVLSGAGGLLGVALGLVGPQFVKLIDPNRITVTKPEHVIMAFGISAAVGIVFGLYPAWRAANMDPVEALRHE